jgi:superoxide reductase
MHRDPQIKEKQTMAQRLDIYKCDGCGQLIEVLGEGAGDLACCGTPMKKLDEKTADAAKEKHVPYIEKIDGGYKVKIGRETAHPMEDDHYIEWIELLADDISYTQFLKPGMAPEAEFCVDAATVSAREHCNKHGLWRG